MRRLQLVFCNRESRCPRATEVHPLCGLGDSNSIHCGVAHGRPHTALHNSLNRCPSEKRRYNAAKGSKIIFVFLKHWPGESCAPTGRRTGQGGLAECSSETMSHTSFRRGADNILVTGDLERALAEIDQHRPGRSRADVLAYFLTDADRFGPAPSQAGSSACPGPAPRTALEWRAAFEGIGPEGKCDRAPDISKAPPHNRGGIRDATAPHAPATRGGPGTWPNPPGAEPSCRWMWAGMSSRRA
jgi:hypothetical protein